jgi:hypothetical protein
MTLQKQWFTMTDETANMAKAYLTQMGLTVVTKCLSEHMTALEDFSYQLVTISLRLIAEVLSLGLFAARTLACKPQ